MRMLRTHTVSRTIALGDIYGREVAKGTATDVSISLEARALERAGFVIGENVVIISDADYERLLRGEQ